MATRTTASNLEHSLIVQQTLSLVETPHPHRKIYSSVPKISMYNSRSQWSLQNRGPHLVALISYCTGG